MNSSGFSGDFAGDKRKISRAREVKAKAGKHEQVTAASRHLIDQNMELNSIYSLDILHRLTGNLSNQDEDCKSQQQPQQQHQDCHPNMNLNSTMRASIFSGTAKNESHKQNLTRRRRRRRRHEEFTCCQSMKPRDLCLWSLFVFASIVCCSQLKIQAEALRSDSSGTENPERHLQLLRSANVELSRRNELNRLQRDTPVQSNSGSQGPAPICGYPGSPAHASVVFNTSHVVAGTAASYTCDNGYELLGPPRRICQANGTWSPIGIPFCVLNVGLGKAAMQSSTAGQGSAQKAVDGSTTPYFQSSICTMTDVEQSPWWYVNLLEPYLVQIVRIDFGTACCANRQKATIAVRVGNNRPDLGNNPLCNRYHGFIEEGKPLFLPCTRPAPGAFVSIHLESPSGSSLSICETFIYTDHALSIEQCPSFRDQPLGSTATYNGKCYLFHNNQALTFDGAKKFCDSRGGSLVDETSPALQGFLSWELYRRHRNDQLMGQYWLGAQRDTRNPQNWKWINGKDVQISFWNSLATTGNCSRFDGSKGWLWSDTDCNMNLNFICQYRPLSCGKPEKPTNSTLLTKNIDNGTVIEYQCAPGNLLMGPKSRACLPTGFFSEFAPKCKYLDCQLPAMIPNGDYKLLNGTTSYQSIVTYFCNEGYQIYGKSTLTCDVDERWNGPPPRCEPLLCPAPVPPSNGYVTLTSNVTIPGTQATYDCRPGYELVGDRLLSCLNSGSWDNSFPYCRVRVDKGNLAPNSQDAASTSTTTPAPIVRPQIPVRIAPNRQQTSGIQFPSGFSSGRIAGSSTQPPASSSSTSGSPSSSVATIATSTIGSTRPETTTTPATPSSSTASLNGLAGQFVSQNSNPMANADSVNQPAVAGSQDQVNRRQPSQSSSINQFGQSNPQPTLSQTSRSRPSQSASSTSFSSTQGTSTQNPVSSSTSQTTSATSTSNRQQTTTSNRFPFGNQMINGNSISYESAPLATTNSISVHANQQQQVNSVLASSLPTTVVSPATTSNNLVTAPSVNQHHQHLQSVNQNSNVLASFSPPIRAHNSLASTRYSLDGIIAVAIFGGFIFLGAIITILVIIIRRRKSGHSSTIDAQTISTYDSNGEHNGLYRNYQQAWENLRFASPNSQPKSSGNAGLITAHVSGGPSVGMKNFASPAVTLVHHAHPMHQMHGHHNLAMDGTSSSSQSSSLGGDPLLRSRHHHHHHAAPHMAVASHRLHHTHQSDDDDDLGDDIDAGADQGILSSDEANYHQRSNDGDTNEGFRDTNELTINADTVVNGNASRHRLYSANSMSRNQSMAAVASNRLSMGNLSVNSHHAHIQQTPKRHHHHHHRHGHHSGGSAASSQHQRLVSSSTPSASTRSSQASPPGDDHSLDRLAYGNSWHPSVGASVAAMGGAINQTNDAGGNHNPSGGGGSRNGENRRYS